MKNLKKQRKDIGCLLITRKDTKIPGIGLMLIERTLKGNEKWVYSYRVNPKLEKINKKLGLNMGKMRQLVMLNRKRETSRLVISDKTKDRQLDIKEAEFELVTTVEEYEKDINDFQLHGGHRGHKSKIRVYFENPYMNYQVWRCKKQ